MSRSLLDYVPRSAIGAQPRVELRLPLMGLVDPSFVAYPVPCNLNYMRTFGAFVVHAGRPNDHRRGVGDALRAVGDAGLPP